MNDIDEKAIENKLYLESNARLIEWSDGSFGFAIGDEIFEIREDSL